jgi:hypothetical protein
MTPPCVGQNTVIPSYLDEKTHDFQKSHNRLGRLCPYTQPVLDPIDTPLYCFMFFTEGHGGIVNSQCLYGFCIARFSTVNGDEMKYLAMSSAMHSQTQANDHGPGVECFRFGANLPHCHTENSHSLNLAGLY